MIHIYFDIAIRNLIISDKEIAPCTRYCGIATCENVPAAEAEAEALSDEHELGLPQLDSDLADQSQYSLSPDDAEIYLVQLNA